MSRPALVVITAADYCDTGWPARPGPYDHAIRYETCAVAVQRRLGGRGPCGQPATWRVRIAAGQRAARTDYACDDHVSDDAVATWRAAPDPWPLIAPARP